MNLAVIVIAVLVACAAGATVALTLARQQAAASQALAERLRRDTEAQRDATISEAIERVITMAGERLSAHTDKGSSELEAKKGLIDAQLQAMSAELGKVTGLVKELETGRATQFGELSTQIRHAGEQTTQLADTTRMLREALASTKARGQWGERMAEDVLRLAGFIENVNYRKQRATQTGGIPDFTFLLPRDLLLHMDVKFPLDNYLRFLEADRDAERERYRAAFLKDVRQRVKELSTRDYIDPGGGTVDCVLLFIPNEQLYAFIQEQDSAILDTALRSKVVFCSPLTLFAVLAVIRQSVDNFALERRSDEILSLLGGFSQQWDKFVEQMDRVGTHIDRSSRAYEELVGTRRRQLERPLEKLEELRRDRDLPATEEQNVLRLASGTDG